MFTPGEMFQVLLTVLGTCILLLIAGLIIVWLEERRH